MKTKETETKYQAYVRVRETEDWTPVTMWKKPFIVLNQEILNWLVPQLAAKFPENEYKIEEYKAEEEAAQTSQGGPKQC
jgi:hypothetical protein